MSERPPVSEAPWVLLPGTLCSDDVFAPLLLALGVSAANRRYIAMDAPDVSDYAEPLRNALRGGDIVCGFSLGAMVAAHNVAALRSARAIVLLACNPFPDPPGNRANRTAVRDRVLRGDGQGWIEENWAAMSRSNKTDIRETVIAMARDRAHLIPAQTELAASRPGAAEWLVATDVPLVFVTGSDDRLTPPDQVRPIADAATSAHLSIVEGAGHFALLEAPDRVASAIRNGLMATSRQPHF